MLFMPAQVTLLVIFLLLWPVQKVFHAPSYFNNLVGSTLRTVSDATTLSTLPAFIKPLVVAVYFIILPFHASKIKTETASSDNKEWFPTYVVDYDYQALDDAEIDAVVYDRILFTEDDIDTMFETSACSATKTTYNPDDSVIDSKHSYQQDPTNPSVEVRITDYINASKTVASERHELVMAEVYMTKKSFSTINQQISILTDELSLQSQASGELNKQMQVMKEEIAKQNLLVKAEANKQASSVRKVQQEIVELKQGMDEVLMYLKTMSAEDRSSPASPVGV